MERNLVVAIVDVDLGDHVIVPDGCIDRCLVRDDMKTSYHVAVQPAGIEAEADTFAITCPPDTLGQGRIRLLTLQSSGAGTIHPLLSHVATILSTSTYHFRGIRYCFTHCRLFVWLVYFLHLPKLVLVQTAESLIFLFLGFLSANNHTKKHS